jgi:hypothetical protein
MKESKLCYLPFDKFVFRSPTFPFSSINAFSKVKSDSDEYFKDILNNDKIREALFLASPTLLEELKRLSDNENKDDKYLKDLKISLVKYLLRMASRCTPFGLFAGFSLGEFGEHTEIKLSKIEDYRSHTRFDMNYLVALSLNLIKNPAIRNFVKYYPNSSLNRIENKIRYVEYKYVNAERMHNIVSVDNSIYLEKILKLAAKGADIKEQSSTIVDDEITYETAEAFVNELVDSQLLISEIEPTITGDEYIHQLLDKLKDISGIEKIIQTLKNAQKSIEEIDNSKPGDSVDKYLPLSEMIKPLGTDFKINYLFQTDLFKPCESAFLNKKISEEILEGVEFLSKLAFEPAESNISKFIERFEKKYGEKEVCILNALDPELGIGFLPPTGGEDNSPLLEKLPMRSFVQGGDKIYWNRLTALLDRKILDSVRENKGIIQLVDEDVKDFDSKLNKMAPTFSAVAKIVGKNNEGKDQIYISSVGGSSSAYLIGRFCHADKDTNEFVKEMARKEEEILRDAIVAEIVHLPQARVGNVLLHPQFHKYEIPYLARSNSDVEHQIRLDDIFLSVHNKKVYMRSKRLNKRVIPRLSNAHNFSFNAQPIYHFLCEMQFQDVLRGVGLPLGNAIDRYEHIPRIVYKNIIFHLAEWKVKKKEVEPFSKIKDPEILIEKVTEWRIKRNIPKLVMLEEGDNKLLINLENSFCIEMLLTSYKGEEFKLCEFIFDEKTAVVRSDEGAFLNEFVISYYRSEDEE